MDIGLKKRAMTRLFELSAGVFMLRYESADDRWNPPKIAVSTLPGGASVEFLYSKPDHTKLLESGDVVVFRVDGEATLAVMLLVNERAINESVNLKLERLDRSVPANDAAAPEAEEVAAISAPSTQPKISLVKTDGVVPGEMAVEALTVSWPGRPDGSDIEYALEVERLGWCPAAMTGTVAGTRDRKLGVLGASFQLTGDAPAGWELEVRAVFARSGIKTLRGRNVVIAGEGLQDVLLALNLAVAARSGVNKPEGLPEAALRVA